MSKIYELGTLSFNMENLFQCKGKKTTKYSWVKNLHYINNGYKLQSMSSYYH